MGTQKKLKLAIVGLSLGHAGTIGPKKPLFIANFRNMENVEVVAYCEEDKPSLLDEAGVHHPEAHVYDSVDELIAKEDFDVACVVMTPRDLPAACIKLAEAGKHFFMDKQFARTSADLVPVVKAVRSNGVKTFLGYPWSFHPAAKDVKKLLDDGILGRPLDIESHQFAGQRGPGQGDPTAVGFRNDTEGGGVLHYIGCHHMELMRSMMGCEVKSVVAMTGRPMGYIEEPLEDIAILAMEYENGAFGSLHNGYTKPSGLRGGPHGYESAFVVRGTEGWASWTPVGGTTVDVHTTHPDWRGAPERTIEYDLEPYLGYGVFRWHHEWLQSFIDDVLADRESYLNVDAGLKILQSIDAAYESARTGRRVEVKYGV